MAPPRLSFVIPTYNRRDLLAAAVDSALVWLDRIGGDGGEIVLVDDGSTDGTQQMVATRYAGELASGRLVFHQRARNGGAAAAKNSGAALARGDWIVFLDSDDEVIPDAVGEVVATLAATDAPIVFFRCIDLASGELIGAPLAEARIVPLESHAGTWRYGECLPAVRPEASRRHPYIEDMPGYEAISYFRMVRELGPILLTPIVARRYRTEGADRVTNASRLKRSVRNRKYASIMMREFRRELPLRVRGRYLLTYMRARFDYVVARGSALLRPAR